MTSSAALHEHTDRPALQLEPVLDAARAALRPPGPVRWVLDPRPDRVELRAVIRRWSTAVEPAARLAQVAAGTALRAARLAVAVQGREPLVSHPDQPGVLAVLRAGGVVAPRREELALHAMLRHATDPAPVRVGKPDRTAVPGYCAVRPRPRGPGCARCRSLRHRRPRSVPAGTTPTTSPGPSLPRRPSPP
jgi:hypothetical protein